MRGTFSTMNIITTSLIVLAIWLVYLSAVTTSAVAVRDEGGSRVVESVAAGGVFVATALSLLAIAWMR
jgi:hypothetical protein